jgi:hypothetical protein
LNLYQVSFTEDVDVRQLDLKHRVERSQTDGNEFGRVAAIVSINLAKKDKFNLNYKISSLLKTGAVLGNEFIF